MSGVVRTEGKWGRAHHEPFASYGEDLGMLLYMVSGECEGIRGQVHMENFH